MLCNIALYIHNIAKTFHYKLIDVFVLLLFSHNALNLFIFIFLFQCSSNVMTFGSGIGFWKQKEKKKRKKRDRHAVTSRAQQ